MGCGDGSETESVTKEKGEKKSATGIGASLTPDYRDIEVSCQFHHGLHRYRGIGASLTPDYRYIEVSVPASPRTTEI